VRDSKKKSAAEAELLTEKKFEKFLQSGAKLRAGRENKNRPRQPTSSRPGNFGTQVPSRTDLCACRVRDPKKKSAAEAELLTDKNPTRAAFFSRGVKT